MTSTTKPTPDFESATLVLRALKANGRLSPAALVRATGLSRATVHRRLLELQESGFVEGQGATPHRKYRVFTVADLLLKQAAEIPSLRTALLTREQTQTLSSALELLARLNLGQWNVFCEELRFRVSMEHLSLVAHAETLISRAKEQVWKLPSNASLGIYNEAVATEGTLAWEAHRAIRHRLAWDRTPEGSMGVYHDEPLAAKDGVGAVACWGLSKTHVLVLFSPEFQPVFLKALAVYQEMARANALALMDFLSPTREATEDERRMCKDLLSSAQQVLGTATFAPARTELDLASIRQVLSPIDAPEHQLTSSEVEGAVHAWAQSAGEAAPLPEGFLLGHKGSQARVLQLGVDDASVIRGASYSPQTAALMAQNMARALESGQPAGSGRRF